MRVGHSQTRCGEMVGTRRALLSLSSLWVGRIRPGSNRIGWGRYAVPLQPTHGGPVAADNWEMARILAMTGPTSSPDDSEQDVETTDQNTSTPANNPTRGWWWRPALSPVCLLLGHAWTRRGGAKEFTHYECSRCADFKMEDAGDD